MARKTVWKTCHPWTIQTFSIFTIVSISQSLMRHLNTVVPECCESNFPLRSADYIVHSLFITLDSVKQVCRTHPSHQMKLSCRFDDRFHSISHSCVALSPVIKFLSGSTEQGVRWVGGEHMVFCWVLVRVTPGSDFPTRSIVDTEKDSSCSSGWPSLPQLICMPLTGTQSCS